MENNEKTPDVTEVEFDSNDGINGDIDNENYAAAIKCIFSKAKTIRGAFCLLLRSHDSKIIELVLWTTKSASNEDPAFNQSMNWEDFSWKIPSIGPLDKESCEKLKSALIEKLSKETIDDIFKDPELNVNSFSSKIRELFEGKLYYLIEFYLEFEPFNKKRLKKSGYEREETPSDANAQNVSMTKIMFDQMDSQVLACTAIVDPVNGIAVSKLEEGDIVEVVISTSSTLGALLADHYAKSNKVPEYPVKNVTMSENGAYIINLEGDGGATCVVKTSSDLRLRAKKGYIYESSISGRNLMIIAGVSIVVFILALILLIRLLIG